MDVRPSSEVLQQTEGKGFQNQHIQFESEAGIEIDARLYFRIHPAQIRQYCCWPISCPICWRQRSRRREEWCWFSNRGILSRMTIGGPYVGNWLANTRAEQIGVSLPGRRAHDILGGVDLLCSRKDVDPGSIRAPRPRRQGHLVVVGGRSGSANPKGMVDKTPYSLSKRFKIR